MAGLCLSFSPSENWRESKYPDKNWRALRKLILERDNYTCIYCGYKSDKYQIVHHIDDNPTNDDEDNLQTVCQMCNLILHAGQGCSLQGVVDLYCYSDYSQEEIIRKSREMRDDGKKDREIIEFLGLQEKIASRSGFSSFCRVMNDRNIETRLEDLYGFVSSRKPKQAGMYANWRKYHKQLVRQGKRQNNKKTVGQRINMRAGEIDWDSLLS